MSRRIEVVTNGYPDALYGGQTVRVVLWFNRNQTSAMTLTPGEAETLLKALSDHLSATTALTQDDTTQEGSGGE